MQHVLSLLENAECYLFVFSHRRPLTGRNLFLPVPTANRTLYKSKLSVRLVGRVIVSQLISAFPQLDPPNSWRVYPGQDTSQIGFPNLLIPVRKQPGFISSHLYTGPLALFRSGNLLPRTQQPQAGTCPFDTYGHLNYTGGSSGKAEFTSICNQAGSKFASFSHFRINIMFYRGGWDT